MHILKLIFLNRMYQEIIVLIPRTIYTLPLYLWFHEIDMQNHNYVWIITLFQSN